MADLDAIHANHRFHCTIFTAKVPGVILSIIELEEHVQIMDIYCCFFFRMFRTPQLMDLLIFKSFFLLERDRPFPLPFLFESCLNAHASPHEHWPFVIQRMQFVFFHSVASLGYCEE